MVHILQLLRYLSSVIDFPVPLPVRNPFKKLWNWTTDLIQVSITASYTFQITSISPIPRLYVFPFGIITNKIHPSYIRMDPVSHMNWNISTNLIHWVGLVGTLELSSSYASLRHYYIHSSRRWV